MTTLRKSLSTDFPAPSPRVVEDLSHFLTFSTGITIDGQRLTRMLFKLEKRMIEIGTCDWEEYYRFLNSNHEEFLVFAAMITVNKTNFFREEKHFEIIKNYARSLAETGESGKFLCWSAACSTGEEVYSLAMTLNELKSEKVSAKFDFGILGSDINRNVLKQAETGVYSEDVVCREVPLVLRKRYFLRGRGSQQGLYKVSDELRSKTKFRLFNLVRAEEDPPVKFHVILLRNVLIYFSKETQKDVILAVCSHLKPAGLLILGHCEHIPENLPNLRAIGSSVYRFDGSD